MNHLKKALCVLMVFVLLLGLGIPSLAAFTDSAQIKYTQQVELMTGIGIISGFPDGSFQPKGDLTRAQAAKIITYLNLGKEAGDAMGESRVATQFSDVPETHWASAFVNYCYNMNIIAGDGHGHFMPDRKLTAFEFAKMLLVSLGYGQNDEFIGADWKKGVASTATNIKLFNGNYAAVGDALCNREEAMLYAYNALFANKVTMYGGYYVNSIPYTGEKLGTLADNYGITLCSGTVEYQNGYYIDSKEGVFAVADYQGSPDDLGRQVEAWCQRTSTGEYVPVTDIVFTDEIMTIDGEPLYDGTTISDWTNRSSKNYIGQAANKVTYYNNGVNAGNAVPVYGRGDKVIVIDSDSDKKIDKVLVTTYTAAAAEKAPYTTTASRITYVVIPGVGRTGIGSDNFDVGVEATRVEGYADIKAGDMVYYSFNNATQTYQFFRAKAVRGQKVSQNARAGSINFGNMTGLIDSQIPVNSTLIGTGVLDLAFNQDTTIYLDQGGYVLGYLTDQIAFATNYVLLVDARKVETSNDSDWSQSAKLQARVVFPDGKMSVVEAASITSGKAVYTAKNYFPSSSIIDDPVYGSLVGTFYSYYTASNGQYVLAEADAVDGGTTITQGAVYFDGVNTANNQTIFIVRSRGTNGNDIYESYVGYKNVPSTGKNGAYTKILFGTGQEKTLAKYVYVDAYNDTGFNVSYQYAYITDTSVTTIGVSGGSYTPYPAIMDGISTTLKVWTAGSGTTVLTEGLYEVSIDKSGYATIVAPGAKSALHNYDVGPSLAGDGIIVISGDKWEDAYGYSNSTIFYIVEANGSFRIGSVNDIILNVVEQISIRTTNSDIQEAAEVYVHY